MKTFSMKGSVRVQVEVNCKEHSWARLERTLPSTFKNLVADLYLRCNLNSGSWR